MSEHYVWMLQKFVFSLTEEQICFLGNLIVSDMDDCDLIRIIKLLEFIIKRTSCLTEDELENITSSTIKKYTAIIDE
jgi:hypothetical protein